MEEPFVGLDSVIHRLDPRVRIIVATLFSIVVAVSYHIPALGGALFLSLCLAALATLPFGQVVKRLWSVNLFVLLLWLVLPWSYGGDPLYRLGPVGISRAGILLAAQITLKANAIMLALMALVATLSPATLGHALGRLMVPAKVVHLLLMTYRYIFVIRQEYQRLRRAAQVRGFQAGTNLHTYRTYAYLAGMLFVRAAARAERVQQAMLCRGFQGKFHSLQEFRPLKWNWYFGGLMAVCMTGLAAWEWVVAAA